MKKLLAIILFCLVVQLSAEPIGRICEIDIILPDNFYTTVTADERAPLLLRVASIEKKNDSYQYIFEVTALEAGRYNIIDYLRRTDGTPVAIDREHIFEAVSTLKGPFDGKLEDIPFRTEAISSHYGILTKVFWFLWLGLLVLYIYCTRPKKIVEAPQEQAIIISPDEKLIQILETQKQNDCRESWQQIEALFIQIAVEKLELKKLSAEEQIESIFLHSDYGPLFRIMEEKLHSPTDSQISNDLLLEHFRRIFRRCA